jgi:4'-phosphopantetheinyl transferase
MVKITNQFLNTINWVEASACDYAVNNNIDLWRIHIPINLSKLAQFSSLNNPAEIDRANRYYHTKDKNRFIISRAGLRIILGRYLNVHPSSVDFEIGQNKKPHIKNNSNLYYNISHSGDWIVIAVSNSELGADIEFVNHSFGYKDVLADNFSQPEVNYINENSSAERFFMLWTRKEALTKATGKGLDGDLKLIPCLDGTHYTQTSIVSPGSDWLINTFKLAENYLASIAANPQSNTTRFWDISF